MAYDTDQLAGQVGNEAKSILEPLSLGDIIDKFSAGDGEKFKQCTVGDALRMVGDLDQLGDNIKATLNSSFNQAILTMLEGLKAQLAFCALSAIPWVGDAYQCTFDTVGNYAGEFKTNFIENTKRSFVGNCIADVIIDDLATQVDRMIQTQGPGGEPAISTDWIADMYVAPQLQAARRFWTILVATDICPQFREQVLDDWGVPQCYRDAGPAIDPIHLRTTSGVPFSVMAACSLPKDYDPSKPIPPGKEYLLSTVGMWNNNRIGFNEEAQWELERQMYAVSDTVSRQIESSGGYLPLYGTGDASCVRDCDGRCIMAGPIFQPPGYTRDIRNLSTQAQFDKIVQSDGDKSRLVSDIRTALMNRVNSWANRPLPYRFNLFPDFSSKSTHNQPSYAPSPTPGPGQPPPDDPACTGGDPRCTCIQGSPDFQSLTIGTRQAITEVIANQRSLFTPPGSNQIAAGGERTVLRAICDYLNEQAGASICAPHGTNNGRIVIQGGGLTFGIDVISGSSVRTDGGSVQVSCEAGAQ
jgi:hypothetical protein